MKTRAQLVCQHLENISRVTLEWRIKAERKWKECYVRFQNEFMKIKPPMLTDGQCLLADYCMNDLESDSN